MKSEHSKSDKGRKRSESTWVCLYLLGALPIDHGWGWWWGQDWEFRAENLARLQRWRAVCHVSLIHTTEEVRLQQKTQRSMKVCTVYIIKVHDVMVLAVIKPGLIRTFTQNVFRMQLLSERQYVYCSYCVTTVNDKTWTVNKNVPHKAVTITQSEIQTFLFLFFESFFNYKKCLKQLCPTWCYLLDDVTKSAFGKR